MITHTRVPLHDPRVDSALHLLLIRKSVRIAAMAYSLAARRVPPLSRCSPLLYFSRYQQVCQSGRTRCISQASSSTAVRVVKIAHILVNKDNEAALDEIESKLRGGVEFEALAKQHSVCRQTSGRGGDLGWISPGTYFPQVEAAAQATAVGQLARATSVRGHHLLKVLAERRQSPVGHISVDELFEVLRNPGLAEDLQLVDVREEWEYQTAAIAGFQLLPLSRLQEWGGSIDSMLDPEKETLVLCHHGVRSMQVSGFLVSQGFTSVKNISGGIDAYSRVDPSVPMY